MSSSPSGAYILPKKILILGDCIQDVFRLQIEGPTAHNVDPITRDGRALFVRNTLTDALRSDDVIRQRLSPLEDRIVSYSFADGDHRAGRTTWFVKDFDGVLRCQPRPRALQPIELNPFFASYQHHLELKEIGDIDACVLEDLALENILAHHENNVEFPFDRFSQSTHPQSVGWQKCSYKSHIEIINDVLDVLRRKAIEVSRANNYYPSFYVMLNRNLPRFESSDALWKAVFRRQATPSSPLVYKSVLERTLVVVHADALRWSGVHISKQISWERTAQDFLSQWYGNEALQPLHQFGHVVVRFGVTGAIYSYRAGSRRVHRLIYDPVAQEVGVFRDVARDGDILGQQTLLITRIMLELTRRSISREFERADQTTISDDIGSGIRKAIRHLQGLYRAGFGNTSDARSIFGVNHMRFGSLFEQVISQNDDRMRAEPSQDPFGDTQSPIGDERIPIGCASWNILTQASAYRLQEIATSIVLNGMSRTLNLPERVDTVSPWSLDVKVPVVRFGRTGDKHPLIVVDRREIESYRVVRNTIKKNIAAGTTRPISISIFGPPGSGKTYVARKIIESVIDLNRCVFQEITLAQIESAKELADKMQDMEAIANHKEGRLPILFVDEFDSKYRGEELGWLQYLLQYMDKKFGALFVFAGGTTHSYSEFARDETTATEHARANFKARKGPDFASRLRGHINILGPNKSDIYDDGFIIRRALVLRSMFESAIGDVGGPPADILLREYVSAEIAEAMLAVTKYKHGSRSMQAIIDMCMRLGGEGQGKFVSSTLPNYEQLSMHVDGAEFMARVEQAQGNSHKWKSMSQ